MTPQELYESIQQQYSDYFDKGKQVEEESNKQHLDTCAEIDRLVTQYKTVRDKVEQTKVPMRGNQYFGGHILKYEQPPASPKEAMLNEINSMPGNSQLAKKRNYSKALALGELNETE